MAKCFPRVKSINKGTQKALPSSAQPTCPWSEVRAGGKPSWASGTPHPAGSPRQGAAPPPPPLHNTNQSWLPSREGARAIWPLAGPRETEVTAALSPRLLLQAKGAHGAASLLPGWALPGVPSCCFLLDKWHHGFASCQISQRAGLNILLNWLILHILRSSLGEQNLAINNVSLLLVILTHQPISVAPQGPGQPVILRTITFYLISSNAGDKQTTSAILFQSI